MTTRLIKFDVVHPAAYLDAQKAARPDLDEMSLAAYRDWLIGLRSNYSDFYTHWLNETGEWEAEEFFAADPLFLDKVAEEVWGPRAFLKKAEYAAKNKWRPRPWAEEVVRAYLRERRPDVVFARTNTIRSSFWRKFDALAVSRLSARMPWNWHPGHFDLLFVDDETYRAFFEMQSVPTRINAQGFDPRLPGELAPRTPRYGAVFVGGLGVANFARRTEYLAELAEHAQIDLWGYWWTETGPKTSIDRFPTLARRFHGPTSGLDMYQIFLDADVVINDYVDLYGAVGKGYNQRFFEVMGAGGFLLTRAAKNLSRDFPADIFVTYDGLKDCVEKIAYYRKNEKERAEIAAAGQAFVLDTCSYKDIALGFGREVEAALARRGAAS